jgi:hypothetical protein
MGGCGLWMDRCTCTTFEQSQCAFNVIQPFVFGTWTWFALGFLRINPFILAIISFGIQFVDIPPKQEAYYLVEVSSGNVKIGWLHGCENLA